MMNICLLYWMFNVELTRSCLWLRFICKSILTKSCNGHLILTTTNQIILHILGLFKCIQKVYRLILLLIIYDLWSPTLNKQINVKIQKVWKLTNTMKVWFHTLIGRPGIHILYSVFYWYWILDRILGQCC